MKNARKIDVLNLYYLEKQTFFKAFVYKLLNPKGKVYLTLDSAPLPRRKKWLHPAAYWLIRHCAAISTELAENAVKLSEVWGREILYIPNFMHPKELREFRPFSERTNTILTVGRIGSRQKASDVLLEAFARIAPKLPDWTLKLAGRTEENMNIAADFYKAHPELRERVIFAGEVRSRNELVEMYRSAKIFAFPSRHESFGIVLTEAMLQGCFAVATNLQTRTELTDNFRYAFSCDVDDIDGLVEKLLYACTHEAEIESLAVEGRAATIERCSWKQYLDVLADRLR